MNEDEIRSQFQTSLATLDLSAYGITGRRSVDVQIHSHGDTEEFVVVTATAAFVRPKNNP